MLRLAFVGTNYSGWQIQPDVPTVQGTLKSCLERIINQEIRLTGCCRTDAGVHAQDYVANFMCDKVLDENQLLKSLNAILPKDIGVYELKKVSEDFNSRFSVKRKTYLYRVWNTLPREPFLYPFVWHITRELNLEALRDVLKILEGRKDFRGFARLEEEKSSIIELKTSIEIQSPLIEIRFSASHFLRFMVRRLVGTAVAVAQRKITLREVERFLQGEKSPYTAPSKGLTLERVYL